MILAINIFTLNYSLHSQKIIYIYSNVLEAKRLCKDIVDFKRFIEIGIK